jgi:hypothetical protein
MHPMRVTRPVHLIFLISEYYKQYCEKLLFSESINLFHNKSSSDHSTRHPIRYIPRHIQLNSLYNPSNSIHFITLSIKLIPKHAQFNSVQNKLNSFYSTFNPDHYKKPPRLPRMLCREESSGLSA